MSMVSMRYLEIRFLNPSHSNLLLPLTKVVVIVNVEACFLNSCYKLSKLIRFKQRFNHLIRSTNPSHNIHHKIKSFLIA